MLRTLVLLAALLAVSQALDYPRPAAAFTSDVALQVSDHQAQHEYHGVMYHNSASGKGLIDFAADSFARLERWDTSRTYDIYYSTSRCESKSHANPETRYMWSWLSAAAWKGNYQIGSVTCQQWEYTYGNTHYAACFTGNTPVAFAIASGSSKLQYWFQNFKGSAPNPNIFNVPNYCISRASFTAEPSLRTDFLAQHL